MIDIPGYRILRPLGRGGMATVYLALQESVQREVALKVMSPTLAGEPQFGERFLREARIAAKLRHPNVVQVHDVAVHGDHHYIAMEYVPGGPVMRKGDGPRPAAHALRVTREIALALGYAHDKGVIHRDIKPDNILLREDGSAALTDFGIARANDVARMTRTGAIVGTPHYMSPEQARGQPLDGRADLYSLGIVFYELLTGRVPYEADDSLAVGILHLTAPLPRLPRELAALQPTLDRMLAKDPDQRFQAGAALAAAIESLQRQLAQTGMPKSPATRPMVATRRTPASTIPPPVDHDTPREPVLGRLDDVLDTPLPRRRAQQRRRGARWGVVALLLLLGVAAVAWWQQDRLRGWVPETALQQLLDRGGEALANGRLTADAGGDGARELYAAVLARDPDNRHAREGMDRVAAAVMARAAQAIDAGDGGVARRHIELARELGVPERELAPLEESLRRRGVDERALADLLERARRARGDGRIDGDDGAIALYREALTKAPGNTIARAGLDDALAQLLQQAGAALDAGDREAAEALVARVTAVNAAHVGLPDLRARLGERAREADADFERRLQQAQQLIADGRLTAPAGANATDVLRALAAERPDDPRPARALRDVAQALVVRAQAQIAEFEFARAEAMLDQAQALAPDLASIPAERERMAALRERVAPVSEQPGHAAPPDERSAARVATLLGQARTALDAGRLLYPPGESAYDKYRAVLALDADNGEARDGIAALPGAARDRARDALAASRFGEARDYLSALRELAPADPELPALQRNVARALLGHAAERLGAGEIARAAQAFDQARELDPNNPDLPAMQARLEQARGG